MHYITRIITLVRETIFPSSCFACRTLLKQQALLCTTCEAKIHPIVSHALAVTESKSITVYAASAYEYPLKQLITAKSYANIVASHHLGAILWQYTPVAELQIDCFVPIPLHWKRYMYRGFNQSHEIASVLSKYKKAPIANLLIRHKATVPQMSLSKEERQINVKDSFSLCEHVADTYKGKHLVLIDDLCTTGATARAAAKQLFKLHPASITLIVGCRVV